MEVGKTTERDLVKELGTKKLKEKYAYGTFDKNDRAKLHKELDRLCKYKMEKDHTYNIYSVYEYPIPKNINKMTADIYKDLIPLLLFKLRDNFNNNKDNAAKFTIGKWVRYLKMVNDNYAKAKEDTYFLGETVDCDEMEIIKFFQRTDSSLDSYMVNALKYLKASGDIIWQKSYHKVMKDTGHSEIASYDDIELYKKIIDDADKICGTKDDADRFYSNKSYMWCREVSKMLSKYGIKYMYQTYDVWAINEERINSLLKLFGKASEKTHIKRLTNEITGRLINNADKRWTLKDYRRPKDEYLKIYSELCNIVINPEAEEWKNEREFMLEQAAIKRSQS